MLTFSCQKSQVLPKMQQVLQQVLHKFYEAARSSKRNPHRHAFLGDVSPRRLKLYFASWGGINLAQVCLPCRRLWTSVAIVRKQSRWHAWTHSRERLSKTIKRTRLDTTNRISVEASSRCVRMQSGEELKETIKGAFRSAASLEPNHGWIKAWIRLDYTIEWSD